MSLVQSVTTFRYTQPSAKSGFRIRTPKACQVHRTAANISANDEQLKLTSNQLS
jgi:hypothetical protein